MDHYPEPWQVDLPSYHDRNWKPGMKNEEGFDIPKPSSLIKDYWNSDVSKIRDRIKHTQLFLNEINEDIHNNNLKIAKLEDDYEYTLFDDRAGARPAHLQQRALTLKRFQAAIRKRYRLKSNLRVEKMKYDAENRGLKRDFPKYWKR